MAMSPFHHHNPQPAKAEDLAAMHLPDQQPPATVRSEPVPATPEEMRRINESRLAFGLDPFPIKTPLPSQCTATAQPFQSDCNASKQNYETNPTKIEPAASSNATVEKVPEINPESYAKPPQSHAEPPQSVPSPARLAANRENAKKSTGPKTKKGKARSSRNAILHGLTSEKEINSSFDYKNEFKAFQKEIHRQFESNNTLELTLVDRLVTIMWRLRRIPSMETELIDFNVEHGPAAAALGRTEGRNFNNIARYESHLDRSLHRTLKELKEARETRRAVPYPCRSMKQLDEEDRLWAICDEMDAEQAALEAAYFASKAQGSQSPLSNDVCAMGRGLGEGKSHQPDLSDSSDFCNGQSSIVNRQSQPNAERPTPNAFPPNRRSPVASSDPATLSPPRERVGPGSSETVPSPQCQDRGEGDLKLYVIDQISSQNTSPAACCGGGSVSEANSGGGVWTASRQSLVAGSNSDVSDVSDTSDLPAPHDSRFTDLAPSSCALLPALNQDKSRAEEEGEGDGGSEKHNLWLPFAGPSQVHLPGDHTDATDATDHTPLRENYETNPIPLSGDLSDVSDKSDLSVSHDHSWPGDPTDPTDPTDSGNVQSSIVNRQWDPARSDHPSNIIHQASSPAPPNTSIPNTPIPLRPVTDPPATAKPLQSQCNAPPASALTHKSKTDETASHPPAASCSQRESPATPPCSRDRSRQARSQAREAPTRQPDAPSSTVQTTRTPRSYSAQATYPAGPQTSDPHPPTRPAPSANSQKSKSRPRDETPPSPPHAQRGRSSLR
jgi:hypothetical protein